MVMAHNSSWKAVMMMPPSLYPDRGFHSYDVCWPQQESSPSERPSTASTCHISNNQSLTISIDYSHCPVSVAGNEDKMNISHLKHKIHQVTHKGSTSTTGAEHSDLESQLNVIGEGTYPRATRLQDGSILGVHTTFQGGANAIVATRSLDHGVTWKQVGEVTRGVGDIDNPFAVQLPSGKILCAFRNHSKDKNGHYSWFRITICQSVDNGATWQYLSTADEVSLPEYVQQCQF
jgi:hypothetical protein